MPTVTRIGVVGAGLMGSGIAESAARAGLSVLVHEPEAERLEHARARIATSLERAVARDQLSAGDASAVTARISYTTSLDALAPAEAVIEAVSEDLAIKRRLFQTLDERLVDASFIASNTSSIPIADLAAATTRPERVIGLHFFSPVPVMALVEVVVALTTGPDTVAAAEAFVAMIGKRSIRAKDRSGFVVNLLLVPYLASAIRMYEEGFATAADIDAGMRLGCGHPVGPLALCDLIGLDVVAAVCDSLHRELGQPHYMAPPLLRRMVAAGRLGRKSGHGFYDYAAVTGAGGAGERA